MPANHIRGQRKNAGFRTQRDLADTVKCHITTIGHVECGTNPKPGWWEPLMQARIENADLKKKVANLQKLLRA